jgi:PEGA domain
MPRLRPLAALLGLSLLLTACLPATLRPQSGSALNINLTLSDPALKVDTDKFRRPGPLSVQVGLSGAASPYVYGLLLPEAQPGRLITAAPQPVTAATINLPLPAVRGFTQLFVVTSVRPLVFGLLGGSVQTLGQAVSAATAGLPAGSWNVRTQVYRVDDYGALRVRSAPDGANVYVAGRYRGRTPLDLDDVEAGSPEIRVEKDGFEPERLTVRVAAEQTALLDLRLRPRPTARLNVTSSVPASVRLQKASGFGGGSGGLSGPAPLSATLFPGAYSLSVTPSDPAISPARLGFDLARDQTLTIRCAPQGTALVCQSN